MIKRRGATSDANSRRRWLTRLATIMSVVALALLPAAPAHAAVTRWGSIISGIIAHPWCLDNKFGFNQNENPVILHDCNSNGNQYWEYHDDDETIRNPATGKCLDVYGQGTTNGTIVQIYNCNGGNNQKWRIDQEKIIGVGAAKCLDYPGYAGDNAGYQLIIWDCNWNHPGNQWWYF